MASGVDTAPDAMPISVWSHILLYVELLPDICREASTLNCATYTLGFYELIRFLRHSIIASLIAFKEIRLGT